MPTLYSLTERLEVGDNIAWIAAKAFENDNVGERVHPKTVTDVEHRAETIQVTAEGVRGGEYHYKVNSEGESEAFFVYPTKEEPTPKGPVEFAERTESQEPVFVRKGYYDSLTD